MKANKDFRGACVVFLQPLPEQFGRTKELWFDCIIHYSLIQSFSQRRKTRMVKVALWVKLKAKQGKEQDVANFLLGGLPLVEAEPKTIAWFALQLGPATFGIFDAFPDEDGRQAHLTGRVAAALMAKAGELLAEPPSIEKVDVLAAKL